jgi:hypothetical protein
MQKTIFNANCFDAPESTLQPSISTAENQASKGKIPPKAFLNGEWMASASQQ